MAAQLGQFALALAWVVAAYSVVASLLGIRLKHDKLIASGRNAALGTAACITAPDVGPEEGSEAFRVLLAYDPEP